MMRRGGLLLCLALGLAAPAGAETDPITAARRAAQALDQAGLALQEVEGAQDRVAALTRTIRAYEAGLAALREGLRRATIRERALALELEARREEIAQLTGVLLTMQRSPETLLLLHPAGPLGTARSGMMLADVTPALQAKAEALRADLEEASMLRALQESAAGTLAEGLAGAQQARTALSQAMSDRTDLPRRFTADPEKLRQLLASADTLEGFASGLGALGGAGEANPLPPFEALRGRLPLPVQGRVLRRMNEADAAGIARPGLLIATRPQALVTAPAPATIRYRGPLLDYGNVMILEPAAGYLLVLAGLADVYGEAGEVLSAGAPVGLMGGEMPGVAAISGEVSDGGGAARSETLYMELRQGNTPVDPAGWFNVTKD
ncbi:peptidoglycan DD-metalloendopeptidase family protein [Actibacterium sp. MT2.3-13A]|uniref:murein hydrolase activator EnvC family protein n=1 Tax=Actibacterium sp. MT2.3-13A TaxID=2828332 RepID=UPI001BAACE98|nr:peptidoglycan DD-metalloendopeptidase family protein [Actibacterium sp. MT2.3-13A]